MIGRLSITSTVSAAFALSLGLALAPPPENGTAALVPPTEPALVAALDIQLDSYVASKYDGAYLDDAQFKCEKASRRSYDCEFDFKATLTSSFTLTDFLGDDVDVEAGDQIDCFSWATARRIAGRSSRGNRYRVKFDKPDCDLFDPTTS